MTKVCKKCKRRLPATAFYRSRITDDGLYWYCKDCELQRCEQRRRRAGMKKQRKARPKLTLKGKVSTLRRALTLTHDALRLADQGQLEWDMLRQIIAVARDALERTA